jgi:hypothetical protein
MSREQEGYPAIPDSGFNFVDRSSFTFEKVMSGQLN